MNVCDNVMDVMRDVDKFGFVISCFQDVRNAGYKQDVMIACLNAYLHPELLDCFGCFKTNGVDLSDKTIFGRSLSEQIVMKKDIHGKRVADLDNRFDNVLSNSDDGYDGVPDIQNKSNVSRQLPDTKYSNGEYDDTGLGI